MQCNDTLRQLYASEEGDRARDEALQLHLASCPSCRERGEALAAAEQLLMAASLEAPAPGFADRVMYRIAVERAGAAVQVPSRWVMFMGLAIVVAALAALAIVWAGSEAWLSLQPGGALLAGLASLAAGLANALVRLGAAVRAIAAAVRLLPADVLQSIEYALQLCCALAFTVLIYMVLRKRGQAGALS